ncbi:PREDICTED: uncharacterized protein LOC108548195 [Eufriesea mexicana]|uniref:uncharacterized protein LOC108548194 n=1 Tax=Eufriesea mexicana TaxID=516756 RepID=UPI00083C2C28|nr:PREDICTED: uncharacterized protein LOC108548194 [Eufriesea mexicana]XP_017756507.1 PREDICTED: uncharacterized protein LOC108548195 [Eufriesea mexicana]
MEFIEWHFAPPHTPHFGGLWEVAAKSFKNHLYRTVGDVLFAYEQFYTSIVEIEAIHISHPLIPLSSDLNDLLAITPGHVLRGDSLTNLPERNFVDTPDNKLSLWQHIQKIKGHYWSWWQKEYLQELYTRDATLFEEGTLVSIIEDNSHPLHWQLRRVVKVHPGEDGIVRVASLRIQNGVYKRGIKRLLSPLPLEDK